MASQMGILIKQAELSDAALLHDIEKLSFPPKKAASQEAFEYRLTNFPQWFLKAEVDGRTVGFINGSSSEQRYITDDVYERGGGFSESGENMLIYGLAVHPEYRHRDIAHKLMTAFLEKAASAGKKHVSLTCKESLIGFYESFGYSNHGISGSVKGDTVNYDMEIYL